MAVTYGVLVFITQVEQLRSNVKLIESIPSNTILTKDSWLVSYKYLLLCLSSGGTREDILFGAKNPQLHQRE